MVRQFAPLMMNYLLIALLVVGLVGGGYYEYTSLQDESIDYQHKISEQRDRIEHLEEQNKQYEDDKTLITRNKWDEAQAKITDLTKQLKAAQDGLAAEKKQEADAAAVAAAAAATDTNQAPAAPPPPPPPSNKLGTITLTDGKTYHDCRLLKVDPDGIVVNHSDGIIKILYAMMSPELQKRFTYDPKQSATLTQEQVDLLEIARKESDQLGN
jgi:hypothetical protein